MCVCMCVYSISNYASMIKRILSIYLGRRKSHENMHEEYRERNRQMPNESL